MRGDHGLRKRTLAIDPTYRGFGYVVLEGAARLVDWGLCEARTEKKERTLRKARELIALWEPDVLVVEDTRHRDCRRGERTRDLIDAVAALARRHGLQARCVPAAAVRDHYGALGATNKDAVARLIVTQFPELESVLPPKRKTWMPEDERMAVFDAVSLSLWDE